MKFALIALWLSIPAMTVQQLASLEPACARQHLCSPVQKPPQRQRVANGAECPVGSKTFCTDDLPWCCVGADSTAYCAKDTTACTK
jgi:hypothetical protein